MTNNPIPESEQSAYFDVAGVILLAINHKGEISRINQKGCQILGYEENELLGKNWFDIALPPSHKDSVKKVFQQLISGEIEPFEHYENPIITKSGQERLIAWDNIVLREEGVIVGTLSSGTDITEQARAEQLLQALNQAALAMQTALTPEDIFEAAGEELKKLGFSSVIFLVDHDQVNLRIKYMSYDSKAIQAIEKLAGTKTEEFVMAIDAGDAYRVPVRERRAIFIARTEDTMRELIPKPFERLVAQLVKLLEVPKYINTPLIVDDKVIGLLSVQSDDLSERDSPAITAFAQQMAAAWRRAQLFEQTQSEVEVRIRIENALRESEERYRNITESARDAILTINQEGKILLANPAVKTIFGYSPQEMVGQPIAILAPERLTNEYLDALSRYVTTGDREWDWGSTELTALHKDGHEFPVEFSFSEVVKAGKRSYTGIVRDISQRKGAEKEINRRARQMTALSDMGQTVASSLELSEVLNQVVEATPPLIGAEGVAVLLPYDPDELFFAAASGEAAEALSGQRIPVSQGVAGEVLQSGRSIIISDEDDSARLYREIEDVSGYHTQSLIAVPLILGGEVIGVMEAVHTKPNAFPETDLQVLETAANWATIAIGNARQHEALQRRLNESQALAAISQALNETINLDHVLQLIVDSASQVIPQVERAVIHLFEEDTQILVPAAVTGLTEHQMPKHYMRPGEGIAGLVMERGKPINVNDTQLDDRFVKPDEPSSLRSLLVAPVQTGPHRLGTLSISSETPGVFSADDERLLAILGVQASLAIESARLFEETRQRATHLELLNDINRTLLQAPVMDAVLPTMADWLCRLMSVDHCYIALWDEHKQLPIPTAASTPLNERYRAIQVTPGEPTITETVIREGNSLVVENIPHTDLISERIIDQLPFQSMLSVPMVVGDQKLGAVQFTFDQSHPFTTEEIERAENAVGQIALAIANNQLLEAEQRRRQEAETLREATSELTSSLDIDQVLDSILTLLEQAIPYDSATVFLQDGDQLRIEATHGSDALTQIVGQVYSAQSPLYQSMAHTQAAIVLEDAQRDPRWEQWETGDYIRGWMGVPLIVHQQIIGYLTIDSREIGAYSESDAALAQAFANQAATAISNARLYTDLQDALQKEQSTRAQLVQSEKLAAMGQLVASVAHELNNPLQAIQNAIYLIKLEETLSKQANEDLQIALDETTRMADLIARLRDTYRPTTADSFQLETLNTLVTEVHKLLSTHLRHSGVTFEFQADPDLPYIPIIRDQIKQVILNLCLNAVETMPKGGQLIVKTEQQVEQRFICLSVSDTGPGIEPENLSRIFEPFFTTKEGGTGLGLAVSYEIVQHHTGRIEVKSEVGQGSTFYVWLPIEQ